MNKTRCVSSKWKNNRKPRRSHCGEDLPSTWDPPALPCVIFVKLCVFNTFSEKLNRSRGKPEEMCKENVKQKAQKQSETFSGGFFRYELLENRVRSYCLPLSLKSMEEFATRQHKSSGEESSLDTLEIDCELLVRITAPGVLGQGV